MPGRRAAQTRFMTQTTAMKTDTTAASTCSQLRSLYLIRIAFSVVWVALVFATCHALRSADAPSAIAAVLLVIYPLWDAIATVRELRTSGDRIHIVNVALSAAATAAMAVAVFSTIKATLIVFGIWAFVAGALQLTVAIRRHRTIGAQWPMMLSGGISVLAGVNFAATAGSGSSGLMGPAGYSAVGAFWFLLAVIALRRPRTVATGADSGV